MTRVSGFFFDRLRNVSYCICIFIMRSKRPSPVERARSELRRVAFEALYSRFAWAYDWVSRTFFLGQWRVWQRAAIPHLQGPRVLEVGMGTGDLHIALLRAGYQVWGIDFSPQMLRQAARKVRRLRVGGFKACRARAQALPFPTGYFDSVVSTFPSDYITDPKTIAEIARVLRAGGRLVIVPGGWLKPRGGKGRIYEFVEKVVYGGRNEANHSIERHVHGASWVDTLVERLVEAGFSVTTHVVANERGEAVVVVATH